MQVALNYQKFVSKQAELKNLKLERHFDENVARMLRIADENRQHRVLKKRRCEDSPAPVIQNSLTTAKYATFSADDEPMSLNIGR